MSFTKWMKAGVIDKDNRMVLSKIKLIEQSCSDFELECREMGGKWGLWLDLDVGPLLVNPIDLVSSLYNDDTSLTDIVSNGQRSRCEVSIRKADFCFEWTILCVELSLYHVVRFKFADYLNKISQTIYKLKQAYEHGNEPIYTDGGSKLEAIEMCYKQLQIEALYPSHYKLMSEKICEEPFVFNILGDHEEHFEIGIGDRSYKTWFSRWDCNLEIIRHHFEALILTYEGTIDISFDTSNTTLQVRFVNVLDKIKEVGPGFGFEYKEYALVKILPNEFVNMPIIAGYCNRKQFVKTLYESLLSLALQYPLESDRDETRFEAYAKIKSPIIEEYIKDEKRDYHQARPRDLRVKDVVVICPDYDELALSLIANESIYSIDDNGKLYGGLYSHDGRPIVMPQLRAWQREIHPIVIASETGTPYHKDWSDYHARGLALAKELRKVLSSDFDLWYAAPFEDNSNTIINSRMLIL